MRVVPASTAVLLLLPLAAYALLRRRTKRRSKISQHEEHVLVIGAGSGVGRAIAVRYAVRGTRVCLVSRGEASLLEAYKEVVSEAEFALPKLKKGVSERVLCVTADFSNAEDMVRVREFLRNSEHTPQCEA